MKRWQKVLLGFGIPMGVLAVGGPIWAYQQMGHGTFGHGFGQGHHGGQFGGHFGGGAMVGHIARELDLTQEQQDRITEIADAAHLEVFQRRKTFRNSRDQLHGLFRAETNDADETRAIAEAQGTVVADLIVYAAEVKRDVFAVLTPEQRAKAYAMMDERGHGRWFRH